MGDNHIINQPRMIVLEVDEDLVVRGNFIAPVRGIHGQNVIGGNYGNVTVGQSAVITADGVVDGNGNTTGVIARGNFEAAGDLIICANASPQDVRAWKDLLGGGNPSCSGYHLG